MSDPIESDRLHSVKSQPTRVIRMVRKKLPDASISDPIEGDSIAPDEDFAAADRGYQNGVGEGASNERSAEDTTAARPFQEAAAGPRQPAEVAPATKQPAGNAVSPLSSRQWRWNLDAIASGSVSGWVNCNKHADETVLVKVYLDDILVASVMADRVRPDLISAGVSVDGKNGFECRIPPRRLRDAEAILVTAELAGEVTVLFRRENTEAELSPEPVTVTWHYDITDLLIYVIHHPHVSGIQRVQCGYLTSTVGRPELADQVRFCAQHPSTKDYFPIERQDVEVILSSLNSDSPAEFDKRKALALKIIEGGARLSSPFSTGDCLVVLGATWMFKDYYRAILKTKRRLGIKYFQVFYDAIPTYLPETCDVGLIDVFNRAMAGLLRYADGVLSISEFSASELRRLAAESGCDCPEIKVVPMGNDVNFSSRKAGKRSGRSLPGPC